MPETFDTPGQSSEPFQGAAEAQPNRATVDGFGKPRAQGRRRLIVLALVVVVAIATLAAVRQSQQRDRAATASLKEAPPTPAVAATAHTGNIGVYFTGLGTVTPLYTVPDKSRVDGQILKVLYTEGQAVHKGAPLVEIDPRPQISRFNST